MRILGWLLVAAGVVMLVVELVQGGGISLVGAGVAGGGAVLASAASAESEKEGVST